MTSASIRVKICGITNLEDALAACEAGADALGFIFVSESPRLISPNDAREIISRLPPFVTKVGVFANPAPEKVRAIALEAGLSAIQLHGNEPPEVLQAMPRPVIKAFRVKDRSVLAALPRYDVSAFLLDSHVPGQLGGTGETFNWNLAVEAKALQKPVILAGGLTPDNVAQAVHAVAPYGVDVSSGVEREPGKKDAAKMREFILRAKRA